MFRLVSRSVTITAATVLMLAMAGTAWAANVEIQEIQYNPPARDSGSNSSLNHEWVVIRNAGDYALKLTGWTLRDDDRNSFEFPSFRLKAGEKVTIFTGSGDDTSHRLYWGSDEYIWDNNRDRAVLKNRAGDVMDTCSYSGGGRVTEC